jgi:hypothetical protein
MPTTIVRVTHDILPAVAPPRPFPYLKLAGSPRSGLVVTLVTSCEDFDRRFPSADPDDQAAVYHVFVRDRSVGGVDIIHGPGPA